MNRIDLVLLLVIINSEHIFVCMYTCIHVRCSICSMCMYNCDCVVLCVCVDQMPASNVFVVAFLFIFGLFIIRVFEEATLGHCVHIEVREPP